MAAATAGVLRNALSTVPSMLAGRLHHDRQRCAHDSLRQIHQSDVNMVHLKRSSGRLSGEALKRLQEAPYFTEKARHDALSC